MVPDRQLQVVVGQSAVLPCLLPSPPVSLSGVRVDWYSEDTRQAGQEKDLRCAGDPEDEKVGRTLVVFVFNKGREDFKYQSPLYQNRTSLFRSQLLSGNFSVKIHNVSEHDNHRTFQCAALHDGRPKYLSNVTLHVVRKRDDAAINSGADSSCWCISITAAVVCLVLQML
ncbi:hypothetical protein ACEWY4_022639 [Coilia grayii]|uniref:Ig-like domain-containing protein n=1 Tax=Coilia grayii TaxID=363190 RepID=A0ABD1J0Q2_9TELE